MNAYELQTLLNPVPPKIPTPSPAPTKKTETFAEFRARQLRMTREEYIDSCVKYSCGSQPWAASNYRTVYEKAAAEWDAAHHGMKS